MIAYTNNADGSLTVWLHRCNEFGDHDHLKMDGSIPLGTLPKEDYKDIEHAKYLIDKMNDRLQDAKQWEERLGEAYGPKCICTHEDDARHCPKCSRDLP